MDKEMIASEASKNMKYPRSLIATMDPIVNRSAELAKNMINNLSSGEKRSLIRQTPKPIRKGTDAAAMILNPMSITARSHKGVRLQRNMSV